MIESLFVRPQRTGGNTDIEDLEDLWIDEPCVYSNFVSSMDGLVAVGGKTPSFISLGSDADRLIMGTLRAFSDAIVIGAGTLRAEPEHRWTPHFIAPEGSARFAALRQKLGVEAVPRLVVATVTGNLPLAPALEEGLVVTSAANAERVRKDHRNCEVISPPNGETEMTWLVNNLRDRGYERILVEGGPHLLGQFIEQGCVDEIFLTISPVLLGGSGEKASMLHDLDLTNKPVLTSLLEVRRASDHLFLRYRVLR